jgi:hypothetical protein
VVERIPTGELGGSAAPAQVSHPSACRVSLATPSRVSPAGYPNRGANREKGTRVAEVGAHGDALVGALPERGLAQGSGTSRRPRRASRRLETVDGARANIVRLGAGEEPGDHQVRERAWLMVVEGAARIEAGGDVVDAEPGTLLTLEDCRQALTLRRLNSFMFQVCTARIVGGVGWLDWPCCQNPGRKPAISRRAMARETKEPRPTGFDVRGQHFVGSSGR